MSLGEEEEGEIINVSYVLEFHAIVADDFTTDCCVLDWCTGMRS